jgi:hypothetical protein
LSTRRRFASYGCPNASRTTTISPPCPKR